MLDLSQVYKKYSKDIYTYIFLRVGKKRETADDILQETFYRAFKYRANYNPNLSNIRTWLTTIAKNLVTDYYKGKYKDMDSIEDNQAYSKEENFDENVAYDQIVSSLELLKDKEKELIILRYINEFDMHEIAQLLEMSYDNVKVACNRAIQKLRTIINK